MTIQIHGIDHLNIGVLSALPDDAPVVMLNLMRFRDQSLDGKGSGRDAYLRYSALAIKLIKARRHDHRHPRDLQQAGHVKEVDHLPRRLTGGDPHGERRPHPTGSPGDHASRDRGPAQVRHPRAHHAGRQPRPDLRARQP